MKGKIVNLYTETMQALESYGHTLDDVSWVGSWDGKYRIPVEEMETVFDVDYDNGYGGQEIATDLVIVGEDWWMTRGEYDGSEWWSYHVKPVASEHARPFSTVCNGDTWSSIEEMNDE